MTAFVHRGVPRASTGRLEEAVGLERALVDHLREAAPDLGKDDASTLHLRVAAQRLQDAGHASALPERIWRVLQGLARDGRGERDGRGGSLGLGLRRLGPEAVRVTLHRSWDALAETAERRRLAGLRLLQHLLSSLPAGVRGTDLLVETTFRKLLAAIRSDLLLQARAREPEKLLDRALLWLHDQEVIRLHKACRCSGPRCPNHLSFGRRGFANADFAPLRLHYQDQVLQVHVMAEFVQRGLQAMADALLLAMDYFRLPQEEFLRRWLHHLCGGLRGRAMTSRTALTIAVGLARRGGRARARRAKPSSSASSWRAALSGSDPPAVSVGEAVSSVAGATTGGSSSRFPVNAAAAPGSLSPANRARRRLATRSRLAASAAVDDAMRRWTAEQPPPRATLERLEPRPQQVVGDVVVERLLGRAHAVLEELGAATHGISGPRLAARLGARQVPLFQSLAGVGWYVRRREIDGPTSEPRGVDTGTGPSRV